MGRQTSKWLDPILLVGIFVSISIGVGMVLTGNDTLSGLLVGLLSTVITLLIDIIARIQKTESSILEATKLSTILSNDTIGKAIGDIEESYKSIRNFNFEHYEKLAESFIDACKIKFRELASGSITVSQRSDE